MTNSKIIYEGFKLHAPKKKKVVRGNYAPFMNKVLSKAFMHRSKLKNQYIKTPNEKIKVCTKSNVIFV